jgi:DNA-binding transcriptional LysR family regulator
MLLAKTVNVWLTNAMDTLLSLRIFLRIAEAGSLSAAADKLEISRAVVSKYLKELEERLGVRLVHRTTRRLSLTESGRAFYDRCVQPVGDIDEAMRCASDSTALPRGTLRINCAHAFGRRYVAPALGEYLARHPEVKVDLTLNDRVVDIVDEGFDLAVRIGRLDPSSLVARRLAATQLVACVSPAYLRRRGAPAEPSDLEGHDCLTYAYDPDPGAWELWRAEESVRVRVGGGARANDGETLLEIALAGHGIAMLPTFLAGEALASGRLVPVLPGWEGEQMGIYAVYPSRLHLSAKVRSFVDFLAERFAGLPTWERWRELRPVPGDG